jgi:hypothetical protein
MMTGLAAFLATPAVAQSMSKAELIKQATSALPAAMRDGATVVTYDSKGLPVVLRQGNNGLFCVPNLTTDSYWVICRGTALRQVADFQAREKAEGKDQKAITADTDAAYAANRFSRPPMGTAAYVRNGKTDADARSMWVLFMPNAKAEDLGLPPKRVNASSPWMMLSGTPSAHIMMPQTASMEDMPPP